METVALLSLKNDTPKIEVTMEVTADSNYRPKEKATYQNIKKYVKDNFGVNVHTLNNGRFIQFPQGETLHYLYPCKF